MSSSTAAPREKGRLLQKRFRRLPNETNIRQLQTIPTSSPWAKIQEFNQYRPVWDTQLAMPLLTRLLIHYASAPRTLAEKKSPLTAVSSSALVCMYSSNQF